MRWFFRSFRHAFAGFIHCIKTERNMRIHVIAAGYVLAFYRSFGLSPAEVCIVLLCIALVIGTEMLNTAFERIVDIISPAISQNAKTAKDVAAGAVLVISAAAFAVGLMLFLKPERIVDVFGWIFSDILRAGLFVASLLISGALVALPPGQDKKTKD